MPGAAFLHGDTVTLRTVEREDLDFLRANRNDPAIRRSLGYFAPTNEPATEQFFEDVIGDEDCVNVLVCDDDREDPRVGLVSLFEIDERAGRGELACWIAPDAQGNGYATDATATMAGYAFEERRLHRVRARANAANEPSRAALESVGFVEEGRKREAGFVDGDHVDIVHYGLLAEEWRD